MMPNGHGRGVRISSRAGLLPAHVPGLGRLFGRSSDPAEAWEVPVRTFDNRWMPGRPFRPTEPAQMPSGALVALEAVCGPLRLERLFVVPCSPRLVSSRRCVLTPTEVLAVGDTCAALWIDTGGDGRVIRLPFDRLLAIDDRQILLYGRLRLVGLDGQITVRYNTTERVHLRDTLDDLRVRLAAEPSPTEPAFLWLDADGEHREPSDMIYKWRRLLLEGRLAPEPVDRCAVAVGGFPERNNRRVGPPSGVAILSPRELIVATEPVAGAQEPRYGVDLLAVPRGRLSFLTWDRRALEVHMAADDGGSLCAIRLELDACLVEAMRRAFGSAVAWGGPTGAGTRAVGSGAP